MLQAYQTPVSLDFASCLQTTTRHPRNLESSVVAKYSEIFNTNEKLKQRLPKFLRVSVPITYFMYSLAFYLPFLFFMLKRWPTLEIYPPIKARTHGKDHNYRALTRFVIYCKLTLPYDELKLGEEERNVI